MKIFPMYSLRTLFGIVFAVAIAASAVSWFLSIWPSKRIATFSFRSGYVFEIRANFPGIDDIDYEAYCVVYRHDEPVAEARGITWHECTDSIESSQFAVIAYDENKRFAILFKEYTSSIRELPVNTTQDTVLDMIVSHCVVAIFSTETQGFLDMALAVSNDGELIKEEMDEHLQRELIERINL